MVNTTGETLRQKQSRFTRMVGLLIAWCYANGYELTFGEALRQPEVAKANAKSGAGISNSLHLIKLAIDLNLYINGVYQDKTEAYTPLGVYWESIGGSWGGRFTTRPDGNHFSVAHNGVR
jgi:hypothetical protein